MSVLPDDAVLVPIDMQRGFDEPSWPRRWNAEVDDNGLALLAAWRSAKRPIIHVRHDSVEPGSTLRPDHPGNAHRPGFEPQGEEALVTKSVNSAFIGTDLDLRLRRLGSNTLVVFGITTDMCVSTTVRMASNMGYRVFLVEDACDCCALPDGRGGTIDAIDIHRAHIVTLGVEFATVMTTAEMLAAVRR